jgi:hypothetical protein
MRCDTCGAPECDRHLPTTWSDVEAVEAQITALRGAEAELHRKLHQLQAELSDVVSRLPNGVRQQWYSRNGSYSQWTG